MAREPRSEAWTLAERMMPAHPHLRGPVAHLAEDLFTEREDRLAELERIRKIVELALAASNTTVILSLVTETHYVLGEACEAVRKRMPKDGL